MDNSLENLYVDHLGLSLISTKVENAGFSYPRITLTTLALKRRPEAT